MQTGSSGTLIGWKSGQTTFVPLWDRMEGAWLRTLMSRTYGVSIFIDYCTALATRRKLKGEERDTGLINMNEASSCLAWGYWVPHIPRKGSSAYQGPPPPYPHTPHSRTLAISGDLGQNRGRPPFRSLKVM